MGGLEIFAAELLDWPKSSFGFKVKDTFFIWTNNFIANLFTVLF